MGEQELLEALSHLSVTLKGTDDPQVRERLMERADELLDLLELSHD